MANEAQIYPDVDLAVTECSLRIEVDVFVARNIRSIATALLSAKKIPLGTSQCAPLAPLLILRFGDRRSLPLLQRCFDDEKITVSLPLLRAAAVTYASYGDSEFRSSGDPLAG